MLQRLPIALAQIKAGNNSESLLNEMFIKWNESLLNDNNIIKSI